MTAMLATPLADCEFCGQPGAQPRQHEPDAAPIALCLSCWDPTAVDRAEEHEYYDDHGVVDGDLLTSGVRWTVLRWLHRSCRIRLWRQVRAAVMPVGTRTCWEGPEVWLHEVHARIDAQPWRDCRKDTWRAGVEALAASVRRDARPLTEITQETMAAAINRSDRHVRNILTWLCEEGLLGRILSGTRMPRLVVPEGESPAEAAARRAQEREVEHARRALRASAIAHARAELDAVRTGTPAPPPPADLDAYRELVQQDEGGQPLVSIASVYELRVPSAETAILPDNVHDLASERSRRRPAPVRPQTDGDPARDQEKTVLTRRKVDFFRPNAVSNFSRYSPETATPVEKGRAPRGSLDNEKVGPRSTKKPTSSLSVAQRTAQALLGGSVDGWYEDVTLPDSLRRGVSRTWLADELRTLVAAGWAPLELAWHLITKGGMYSTLPAVIQNPRGWIRASLRCADPLVRPSTKWAVADVEAHNAAVAKDLAAKIVHRETLRDQEKRELGRARRAAIDACPDCDEGGWVPLDGTGPLVRCDHAPT